MKTDRQDYDVRRKSDGLIVHGPVFVSSPEQAVGYYVSCVLKERYNYRKFYATPTLQTKPVPVVKPQLKKVVAITGACPACGYLDPLRDQASHCPNCERAV